MIKLAKFPEAEERIIKNKFVCRKCKSVIRSTPMKVINKEVMCRRCKSKALRPKRKK
ncbi:MAG: 50S ribosomal protein L40e [Candidatus Woesearchaeota archaeon]